jgi:hypothetical protein
MFIFYLKNEQLITTIIHYMYFCTDLQYMADHKTPRVRVSGRHFGLSVLWD